jgi:hypothetical protein
LPDDWTGLTLKTLPVPRELSLPGLVAEAVGGREAIRHAAAASTIDVLG